MFGVVWLPDLAFVVNLYWYHYWLFDKVCLLYQRVNVQFFVVLNLVYSNLISICLRVSPEIWITETILHSMAKLFATNTTLISLHLRNFLFSFFFILITLFLIIFGLVFSKLAA
jgi:hypothetical protein